MSRRNRARSANRPIGDARRISIRSARRDYPDLRKIAQAVASLAIAQAEAEARAQAFANEAPKEPAHDSRTEDVDD